MNYYKVGLFLSSLVQIITDINGEEEDKFDYTYKLRKVTEIVEEKNGKAKKICTICDLDVRTFRRLCRVGLLHVDPKGESVRFEEMDIPIEETRTYALRSRRSIILGREIVSARKCSTKPPVFLTNAKTPKSVLVIMEKPKSKGLLGFSFFGKRSG